VVNCHVTAREYHDEIVFLRKIVPGRSDRSYGIQVARLAGLPATVVARARQILDGLEQDELARGGRPTVAGGVRPTTAVQQLGLFAAPSPVEERVAARLRTLDLDRMTPLDALTLLHELKRDAES
jgi:DNA mismatch repair protein MutS